MLPERHEERARRVAAIDVDAIADPLLARAVLAHRAWLATELGHARRGGVRGAGAARRSTDDVLLDERRRRSAYHLGVRALVMTDHADEARARDRRAARARDRPRLAALRAAAALVRGRARAADRARRARPRTRRGSALDLVDEDVNLLTGGAVEVLVVRARRARRVRRGARPAARARPRRRARRRPGRSACATRARGCGWPRATTSARTPRRASGALREEHGRPNPTWTPWRSTAALALAHLGRRDEAAALADAELALAERFGAPVPIAARAARARASPSPTPPRAIALCRRALAVAGGAPAALESVRVAARARQHACATWAARVEARDALRPALADADAVGAVLLAERARRELVATGLRPRQAAIEGAAALTPRQRQICELAAAGKGNRAIAQELFLSIKTVETHLAAGYRKLGVNTRDGLAAELAG